MGLMDRMKSAGEKASGDEQVRRGCVGRADIAGQPGAEALHEPVKVDPDDPGALLLLGPGNV